MTKPNSKPCMCCVHNSPNIPCALGHHPRYYKDKGLRRVCKDFCIVEDTPVVVGKRFAFVEALMRVFGMAR